MSARMFELTQAAFERHVAEAMKDDPNLTEEDAIEYVKEHEYQLLEEDAAEEADYRYELARDEQFEREWERQHDSSHDKS